jgi:hypothetical protein
MRRRVKGLVALLIYAVIIGLSITYLPPYLLDHSHHVLSHRDAFLPVVLIALSLLVGVFIGLWVKE